MPLIQLLIAMTTGAEPTLRDVMALLKSIEGKVVNQPPPSPNLRPASAPQRDRSASAKRPRLSSSENCIGSWASSAVIERVLFPHDKIMRRVRELAAEVSAAYEDASEESFVVVGLLSGVYMFMADFTRELKVPHQIDFIAASSYGLSTVSSANVKIKKDLDAPIVGKDVLILDEMCDSGRTMACLKQMFHDRGAKSVRACVLLNKAERRAVEDLHLDYVGFECEDEFLVGYGMDWAQRFRSLKDVSVVKRSAYSA